MLVLAIEFSRSDTATHPDPTGQRGARPARGHPTPPTGQPPTRGTREERSAFPQNGTEEEHQPTSTNHGEAHRACQPWATPDRSSSERSTRECTRPASIRRRATR